MITLVNIKNSILEFFSAQGRYCGNCLKNKKVRRRYHGTLCYLRIKRVTSHGKNQIKLIFITTYKRARKESKSI